ncbi:FAD-binding protein [Bacillus sp. FSL W8-0102]|uniref:FAD-binding oxidoreductase n=1 Tax=Bacillus sp. FSL W8-0102 TaxID=2978205 RepID=UPI0030F5323E
MKVVTSRHIEEIKKIVKTGKVWTDESDRFSYSFDASFGTFLPDVVIQTKSVAELAELVKLANREKIPVYPRGQATSLSGGPLPVKGGMVFDLSVLDDLLDDV